jgi:hypothetical protein
MATENIFKNIFHRMSVAWSYYNHGALCCMYSFYWDDI